MLESDYILGIVSRALESESEKASSLIRQSVRVAKLRHDYINLWWLELETINIANSELKGLIMQEVAPHLTSSELKRYWDEFAKLWIEERKITSLDSDLSISSKDKILAKVIEEIENDIAHYVKMGDNAKSPQGLHTLDLYYAEQSNVKLRAFAMFNEKECKDVAVRIKNRALKYLSTVETQVAFGQIYSDVFESNKLYVNSRLAEICPDALSKFTAAYRRGGDEEPESWAQSLTSCRRLLKSLADALYPADDRLMTDASGKERKMSKERYIARLWQFVKEQSKNISGEVLQAQIQDYGNRIDKLYGLSSKGVHSEVSKFEVNQCLIQTYLIAGDLVRLKDNTSALKGIVI